MSEALPVASFFVGFIIVGSYLMFLNRHRHEFREVSRVFCPPRSEDNVSGARDVIREAMFGVTSIEMRCECGKIQQETLLGDHTKLAA